MNIDRTKLEKLFDEHFIDEPSSEVFDAMNEIIDYAEKAVKLFAIPDVSVAERKVCPDCGDLGWVYDKRTGLRSICPCHY